MAALFCYVLCVINITFDEEQYNYSGIFLKYRVFCKPNFAKVRKTPTKMHFLPRKFA